MIGSRQRHKTREEDGRMIVVTYPATANLRTYFTGAGDDLSPTPPASGRGDGPALRLEYAGSETGGALTKEVAFQYKEPIEIHDGEIFFKPVDQFSGLDVLNFYLDIPASAPSSTPGVGNLDATVFPDGHPFKAAGIPRYQYNAAGTGSHTGTMAGDGTVSSFTDLVPVETSLVADGGKLDPIGLWDANRRTGIVTPRSDGEGNVDFVPFNVLAYFVKRLPLASPNGEIKLNTYRSAWIHPSWVFKMQVVKDENTWGKYAAGGICELSGRLLIFRPAQL